MMDKLKAISDRLEAIVTQMEDPATYGDPDLLRRLTREQKELEPVAEAYRAYRKAEADLASAQELLSDPEMKEMAQEEIQEARADMERLREELKILLLPRDPNDGKNVVMEIRGGVGGEEAMLFAADLFRMYVMYVESRGWKLEVTSRSETELGGIKTIEFIVEGEGAWSRLKYESGAHRVQRVPVTESSGRIQTSAATVAVLPEAEEVDFHIDPGDLKIDTFRSSGAGHPHHPPAYRRGGGVPGRAQPVQEQGPGHADPAYPAVRGGAGEAERRHRRPAAQPGGFRRPQRAHPDL